MTIKDFKRLCKKVSHLRILSRTAKQGIWIKIRRYQKLTQKWARGENVKWPNIEKKVTISDLDNEDFKTF